MSWVAEQVDVVACRMDGRFSVDDVWRRTEGLERKQVYARMARLVQKGCLVGHAGGLYEAGRHATSQAEWMERMNAEYGTTKDSVTVRTADLRAMLGTLTETTRALVAAVLERHAGLPRALRERGDHDLAVQWDDFEADLLRALGKVADAAAPPERP